MRLGLRILSVIVGVLVVAYVAVAVISTVKMNRTYTIPQADLALTIPSDRA